MAWLPGRSNAQEPPAPTAPPAAPTAAAPVLLLQNLAPFARDEGAAVVVPFAAGAVPDTPPWHVPDTPTSWQPFGARWPDGSVRQALCLFRTGLPALGERTLTLAAGPGPALPTGVPELPAVQLVVSATVGDRLFTADPERQEDLELGPLRRVELRRARLGDSGLVAEVILTAWRDQLHAQVDIAVFYSDPRLPAMQADLGELAVQAHGMALVLRHAGRSGIVQSATADGSRCVLLQKRALGDGQGLRRTGVLVPIAPPAERNRPTHHAAAVAPLLGATDWRASGAFGPLGHVPPPPPWLAGERLRAYLARAHQRFVAGDRGGDPFFCGPHGLERFAGQTGDQADFGLVKLSLVAATGMPSLLFEAEASVLQEACRPVHYFEADGRPVDPNAHPDWIVWSGRTHWHGGVSKDRLGKPVPEPQFEAHGWTGKDREHWSNNYLGAFAQLTGAHWARAELQNEARLYVAGQTVTAGWSTSNAGAPRGAGRTALSASWMLLVTGDAALRARMDARLQQVYHAQWRGRELPAERVRTMAANDPDARMLDGKQAYWNPWQDAIAACGFAAQHRLTGHPLARELAEGLATNVVRHGWLQTGDRQEIATAMRWQDGAPLDPASYATADLSQVQWATGTAFATWAIGAVEIARVVAVRTEDTALRDKCEAIQQLARAARKPPEDGGMDRFGEFDAMRWD
ncbi:MAG: hypothetical protein MUC36_18165 [Planctomycetes bacterium]|nr:hypothetical protein [Planctomycetota bacterium]